MAYSLIFEANIPRHFVPPTTGCKSPQALWRDDSNSPMSAEPNIPDFELLSALLVYNATVFAGENGPYSPEATALR